MAAKIRHNHPQNAYGALEAPGDCAACDARRAELDAAGRTQHNHAGPFGFRRVTGCPRCIELVQGAAPRESMTAHRDKLEQQRSESMRRHFADPNSKCDHKTCYDW
jgi:hypothetical protein